VRDGEQVAAVDGLIAGRDGVLEIPDGPVLRLDQIMGQALPVDQTGDTVWQAVLENAQGLLGLREGLLERTDAGRLRYRRLAVPPRVACDVVAEDHDGSELKRFTLQGVEEVGVRGWRVSLDTESPAPTEFMRLHARRTAGDTATVLGFGLFAFGAFGLVWARFWPRASH